MLSRETITLALFTLIWTALVGASDYFVGLELSRAIQSTDFSETTGIVVSSGLATRRGSKGSTKYDVSIRYRYQVGNETLEGDRYCHQGSLSSSDARWAKDVVEKHPVGAALKVYYDSADPAHAVLHRGITGGSIFTLLFLTPFNLVMIGLWMAPFTTVARKFRPPQAGGVKWSSDGRLTRIRLCEHSTVTIGLVTMGLAAFLSIFILGFGFGGSPPLDVALVTAAAVVIAGILAAGWHGLRQRSGMNDLILDEINGTIDLPNTCGRQQRRIVAISDIEDVTVTEIKQRTRKGRPYETHVVTLHLRDSSEKLTDWSDSSRAWQFATWLRGRLGMENRKNAGS